MSRTFFIILVAMLIYPDTELPGAMPPQVNYDESKIPVFDLTDPLLAKDGRKVDSAQFWNEVRRPELLKLFADEMFGNLPLPVNDLESAGFALAIHNLADPATVFDGKGTRHQIRLQFTPNGQRKDGDPKIDVLIYTPNNAKEKVPVFIGLNFQGNHTVNADPGIKLGAVWAKPEGAKDFTLLPAREEDRGKQSERWQVEMILDRGFAVASAYYGDIEPDFDGGRKYGVRRLIDRESDELKPDEGNAIATWAWGLTQIRHVINMYADRFNIDAEKIAVIGHSRLGKTALWAGATDPKFALVISNNSGCGGAALSKREFGETVHRINTSFPHWFCDNFKKYNEDVNSLPFDQHELIALIAPRPIYVASAEEDRWADPKGEFLSAFYADSVYRLLGTDGIADVTEMPEINCSVGGTIGYHIRTGEHDVKEFDWKQFLDFAEKHLKRSPAR